MEQSIKGYSLTSILIYATIEPLSAHYEAFGPKADGRFSLFGSSRLQDGAQDGIYAMIICFIGLGC